MPMATPASRIDLLMPFKPVNVVRTMGSRPYRISTTMAARAPTPPRSGTGSRKPNIARLGTVCTMLASATSGALRRGRRAAKTPRGTPRTIATSVDTVTSSTCWPTNAASSCPCASQKRITAMGHSAGRVGLVGRVGQEGRVRSRYRIVRESENPSSWQSRPADRRR